MEKISYSTLLEKLSDPDVDMDELDPFLTYKVDKKTGLDIQILPNWNNIEDGREESLLGQSTRGVSPINILNSFYRKRRRKKFKRRLARADDRKILLSEGDSWFQYPKFLKDTIDWLTEDFNIYSLGAAGDTLMNMLRKNEYWEHLQELDEDEIEVHAMLLSAGGNDIVGANLRNMLIDYVPGAQAADLLHEETVSRKFQQLENDYESIFERLELTDKYKNLPVLFHGYNYATPLPDQGSNIPPLDGWLGAPMRDRGITDLNIQKEIITILMEEVNTRFEALANRFPNAIFVDNRNLFPDELWHDELHPHDEGFKLVAENFKSHLDALGINA